MTDKACQSPVCLWVPHDLGKSNKDLSCRCTDAPCHLQGGLRLTPAAFFCNWFATVLVTLVAQSLGLLIGATVMNAKTAQTVTAVIMLTMMLGVQLPGLSMTECLHNC